MSNNHFIYIYDFILYILCWISLYGSWFLQKLNFSMRFSVEFNGGLGWFNSVFHSDALNRFWFFHFLGVLFPQRKWWTLWIIYHCTLGSKFQHTAHFWRPITWPFSWPSFLKLKIFTLSWNKIWILPMSPVNPIVHLVPKL